MIIFFKEREFLFFGRYEYVWVGGFLFDVFEIKWIGDNFCCNLVIFYVIIFNLIYIVCYLLLVNLWVWYCFIKCFFGEIFGLCEGFFC